MEENNTQTQESSTNDLLNTTIGENEGSKALECKPVVVAGIIVQTHNKDNKKMDTPLVNVMCKHPDKDEVIKITQIKWINGDKMVNTALFATVDEEGKFMKDSGVARLLSFANKSALRDLEGFTFDTVKESETSKYMCLKCY